MSQDLSGRGERGGGSLLLFPFRGGPESEPHRLRSLRGAGAGVHGRDYGARPTGQDRSGRVHGPPWSDRRLGRINASDRERLERSTPAPGNGPRHRLGAASLQAKRAGGFTPATVLSEQCSPRQLPECESTGGRCIVHGHVHQRLSDPPEHLHKVRLEPPPSGNDTGSGGRF